MKHFFLICRILVFLYSVYFTFIAIQKYPLLAAIFIMAIGAAVIWLYFHNPDRPSKFSYESKMFLFFSEVQLRTIATPLAARNDAVKIFILTLSDRGSAFRYNNGFKKDIKCLEKFRESCFKYHNTEIYDDLVALCKNIENAIIQKHDFYKLQSYFYNWNKKRQFKKHILQQI